MEMKDWIRAARQSAGLTQGQLGEAMGLTKGNVSAWENARHEASHEQIARIAQITGYTGALPGFSSPVEQPPSRWPFPDVSEAKVNSLAKDDRLRLEAAVLICAAQLGLDVKR